jgi:hypothetical protein
MQHWKCNGVFRGGFAVLSLSVMLLNALNSRSLGGLILGTSELGTKQTIGEDSAVEINSKWIWWPFFWSKSIRASGLLKTDT